MFLATIVGVLAVLNSAVAHPQYAYPNGKPTCPKPPLPEIVPQVFQSVIPAPVNIGPAAPGVIEHASAPYEINYFGKPWIIKHQKSAALNVFSQTPVVVDEYSAPAFNEAAAPPAVVVEEVCGAPAAAVVAPAPAPAPAPVYTVPAPVFSQAHAAPALAPLPAPAPCL